MRTMTGKYLEGCRITEGQLASEKSYGFNGAFRIPHNGLIFMVICSDGEGWDHVSVSLPERCPTWDEMCHIRGLFFSDHETVMQLHPRKDQYVNNHSYCLHLWRPGSRSAGTLVGA